MDRPRNQFPVSYSIAAQLVCHDLPGLSSMRSEQAFEEPFRGSAIPLRLKIHINHFTIPKALRGAGSPGLRLAIGNAVCH